MHNDQGSCPSPESPVTAHVERSRADAPVAHTPTPWQVSRDEDDPDASIAIEIDGAEIAIVRNIDDFTCIDPEDDDFDKIRAEAVANAEFIVRAVNSHDELVAALKKAVETIRAFHGMGLPEHAEIEIWKLYQQSPEMKAINAALKAAEGNQ